MVLPLSSCKQYYIVHDFETRTKAHKKVAVLPVKMIFTGNKPKKLTDEQIKEIEIAESKAFQIALLDEILESTRGVRKPIRVTFLTNAEVLKKLEEGGISIRDSWDKDPKVLAQLLNVDAVVKMDVTKKRYISDLASFGIQVAQDVIGILGGVGVYAYTLARGVSKTNDVTASAQLVGMKDGTVLWSKSDSRSADWSNPAETVIRSMCRSMGRDFPYRIEKK